MQHNDKFILMIGMIIVLIFWVFIELKKQSDSEKIISKGCGEYFELSSKWKCLEYAPLFSKFEKLEWNYDEEFKECVGFKEKVIERISIKDLKNKCFENWKNQKFLKENNQ